MARLVTVDDMIIAVRSKLDENNAAHLDVDTDILPSLNRGQDSATNILVQKYESPLLTYTTQVLTNAVNAYDFPDGVYEDRIEKVEIIDSVGPTQIPRVSYRDASLYDVNSPVPFPVAYYIIGKQIRFTPAPNGAYSARIWYMQQPPMLVKSLGRVTNVASIASNYFLVDEAGDDLSVDLDSLDSFINIIDNRTGAIKATVQVQNIDGQQITIKTSLPSNRTTIHGQTISTSLTSADIALDDLICSASGSCIPYLLQPLYNYIVQYAVMELKGEKLNEENQSTLINFERAEKKIERSWVGREQDLSVKRKNRVWRRGVIAR